MLSSNVLSQVFIVQCYSKSLLLRMQIMMTAKITTLRTLYDHVVSNSVMFPQILYDIVLYARHFLPVKFFPEYYFYKLCFELPQNVPRTE